MIAAYSDNGMVKDLAAKLGLLDRFMETDIPSAFQAEEKRIKKQWFFVLRFANWPDKKEDGWIAYVCDRPETANLLRAAMVGNFLTREER